MAGQLQRGERDTLTLIMSDSREKVQQNQLHGFMDEVVAASAFLVETVENAFLEKMVSEMAEPQEGPQKERADVVRELAGAGATGMLVTCG